MLTRGLRGCRGWFPLTLSPLPPASIPRECWGTAAVSQEEGGVWDYQISQISICSVSALAGGEGPEVDRLYFQLPRLPLVGRAGSVPCLWRVLGQCLQWQALACAVHVTNSALCNFKNRKNLCQICGCRWESWLIWSPRGQVDVLPSQTVSKKRPSAKMWFSNLENPVSGICRPLWTGTLLIFQVSPIVCIVLGVEGWIVRSYCCGPCPSSPLLLFLLSSLCCFVLVVAGVSLGQWPQLLVFLKMSAYLSR